MTPRLRATYSEKGKPASRPPLPMPTIYAVGTGMAQQITGGRGKAAGYRNRLIS